MNKLGKFEIIEKIGQGAMGVVYKARDPMINRIVALKTLTTGLSEDPNLLKRFYSEARSAGGLQHPNIVTIYELGHEGSTPFIVMQFLNGESLDKLIARRPSVPISQKIGFIVYVCRALDCAHKQNPPVIHRDIKPGNVMVTLDGTVMVVDFGIARLGEGSRSQSAGMLIGTLGYMSPQLFRGGTADARSDIWATGVMLYEILAYERPFDGGTAAALMTNIMQQKPRAITRAAPGTPSEVEAVLDRMLCKETDGRYQSMEEVLLELEPLWRRLQQTDVANLVADSRKLFEQGDLANAQQNIRRALQIDTSNTQAKSLLEKVNAGIRRNQIIPQLKARVEKARGYLSTGQNDEALAEAESIMRVDSAFQPARELFEQAHAAVERTRSVNEAIRALRQRLGEGALTDAEIQLDKVLEMDPGNPAARDLVRQVRAEKARRDLKQRRDETLHRARVLWTNLQYTECIDLLVSAQERFPGDPEIIKLLETARQDHDEQQRQALLVEIRNFIGAQRFDDALGAIDAVLKRYPSDSAAANLRTHALQGREQQNKDRRLKEGKSKLQAWVKLGNYQEVIVHAEKLSKEFLDDFELNELLDFARTEQFQLEKKRKVELWLEQIRGAIKDGRFTEGIKVAQKALGEFPQTIEVSILLERAKKEQSEKEKHELLKQRLREVEKKIDRQELTDAIDLARQTLVTAGPNAAISDVLHRAEREYEFRENRKREQDAAFHQVRTFIEANNLAEATLVLKDACETQLFSQSDPKIKALLEEIDRRERLSQRPELTTGPKAAMDRGSSASQRTGGPANEYIYQQHTGGPEVPTSSVPDSVAQAFSATILTGRQSPSVSSDVPRTFPIGASQEYTMFPALKGVKETEDVEAKPQKSTQKMASVVSVILAAALLISVAVYFLIKSRSAKVWPTQHELALQNQSQELRRQGKFDGVKTKDQEILGMNGALVPWARQDLEVVEKIEQQEDAFMAEAKTAEQQRDYGRAQEAYQQVIALRGPQQSTAQAAWESMEALKKGEDAETIAQKSFDRGIQALSERDYVNAAEHLRESLNRAPEQWAKRGQVQASLARTEQLIAQQDFAQRAENEFALKQYESAKSYATQAANLRDGDVHVTARAREVLRRVKNREEQSKMFEQAAGLEARGQQQQARVLFDRVSTFPDGDDALAEKANEGKNRITISINAHRASVVSNVEEAIKQGRFDIAQDEITSISTDDPDYNRLKSLIAEGRKEDGTFEARSAELKKAEVVKDETTLKSVRSFFAGIRSGRHSHEAEEYVSRIDLDLKNIATTNQQTAVTTQPPPAISRVPSQPASSSSSVASQPLPATSPMPAQPPPSTNTGASQPPPIMAAPVVSPSSPDREKIEELKSAYRKGFQNKNVLLLRHIWPSITDKKVKEYEDTFKIAESIQWSLSNCDAPTFNGDRATFRCVQEIEIKPRGEAPQHKTDAVTFYLEKQGSDWTIARVDAQKLRH